jgi:S1-C subfamily serine protease
MGLRFVTSQCHGAPSGVRVIDVLADTPAAAAGLRREDVITGVDGTKVGDFTEFRAQVSRFSPGDTATFHVWRDGDAADRVITFGSAIAA